MFEGADIIRENICHECPPNALVARYMSEIPRYTSTMVRPAEGPMNRRHPKRWYMRLFTLPSEMWAAGLSCLVILPEARPALMV